MLLIVILAVLYISIYQLVRWAISLQLTKTVSYVFTILLVIIGVYAYTTAIGDVKSIDAIQFILECVVIFGGILLLSMLLRRLFNKTKT